MTTQAMYNNGLRCKGRGFNCSGCKDKNRCVEYEPRPSLNNIYLQRTKYELIKSILKNGDICEFKAWDSKVSFGFYMDGYIYKDNDINIVCGCGGFETQITAIRRPDSMRNAFACFKYGSLYGYDYREFGSFTTVYEEGNNNENRSY